MGAMCEKERKGESEHLVSGKKPTVSPQDCCKARAVKAYQAKGKSELTLIIGQILDVIDRTQKDWWMGQVEGQTAFGWFPSVNVEVIDEKEAIFEMEKRRLAAENARKAQEESQHRLSSTSSTRKSMSVNTEGKVLRVRAMSGFDGKSDEMGPGEEYLLFSEGDILIVTDKSKHDWWLGMLADKKNVRGWFPASKVEILSD